MRGVDAETADRSGRIGDVAGFSRLLMNSDEKQMGKLTIVYFGCMFLLSPFFTSLLFVSIYVHSWFHSQLGKEGI